MRARVCRIASLLLIFVTALILTACASRGASGGADTPTAEGDKAIDAYEPVAALLETSCALSACHSAARGAGQLVLAPDVAHDNLVDVPSSQQDGATLVVPGDPDGSYLLAKLRGADGIRGARMPIGSAPLSEVQIASIADWISGLSAE